MDNGQRGIILWCLQSDGVFSFLAMPGALGMAMLVGPPLWSITFCTDIYGPQRMIPEDFSDLNFSSCANMRFTFWSFSEISTAIGWIAIN